MRTISAETYELAKIQACVQEVLLRAEVMMKSDDIKAGAKHWIRTTIINRVTAIKNDLITALPHEDAQILKSDLLSDEAAIQLREVTDMFLLLNNSKRDMVEAYILEINKHC